MAPANGAELALVEVGTQLCRTPAELLSIIESRNPVAVFAFAPQQKVTSSQIVSFLAAGADDFIFSNMDERLVVAKLKAYLRRLHPASEAILPKLASCNGDIFIDRYTRVVRIKTASGGDTELLNFTQKELDILAMLVCNERKAVSRENILERLWGEESTKVYSDCINKHIETIRRKLGVHGKRIRTVYGSGYMFT
ncbi:MAG: winged helix-turn-helix domain-containing protein [Elusimicrobiales bacterium]|nr:winged helix-turn-helix domain-containing protein [Elusimicrobiales bacterium]